MPANEVHLNDIGTRFLVTIKDGNNVVDLSEATTLNLIFQKPDGTNLTKTATLYTDGTDGKVYYLTVDGDLSVIGIWRLQGFAGFDDGSFYSDVYTFRVYRNL